MMNQHDGSAAASTPRPKSTVMMRIDEPSSTGGGSALVVLSGWEIGLQIPIGDARVLVGRAPGCDVVIPSNSVSREHACLDPVEEPGGRAVYISDLGSSNGTQVNGTPIVRARLRANDKVRMGEVMFRFIENDGDEQRYHEEVHRRIHMHELTGLMTRESFRERLATLFLESQEGAVHCLAMTDLDGLKPINDTHGHEAGSKVIREMGEMIRQTLRSVDFGGVYGGDECMLCFPLTALGEALKTLECLRTAIEQHRFVHGDHLFRVTMSIGLAAWPADGASLDELVKAADEALYEAKRRGRNLVVTANSLHR
ncbi:MAG: hypothetical protein RLZZ303_1072 [Candidatus Hydrogenedentota bacterium]